MTDLETRLARALRAIDSKGRNEVKKLTRKLAIAEEKFLQAGSAVVSARLNLEEAKKKVDTEELRRKMAARTITTNRGLSK